MYRSLETQSQLKEHCIQCQRQGAIYHERSILQFEDGDNFHTKLLQELSADAYREARYIMGLDE